MCSFRNLIAVFICQHGKYHYSLSVCLSVSWSLCLVALLVDMRKRKQCNTSYKIDKQHQATIADDMHHTQALSSHYLSVD